MLALFATVPALLIGGHGFAGARCLAPRMQELALTPKLIELGCDEALWSEIRNKQALLDMEDSEEKCRKRIEFLKSAVASGDDSSQARPARRPDGPYELKGEAPEGVNVEAVQSLLARRLDAKKERDFETADELQAELLAMGIYVNDKQRKWEKAKAASGGFSLDGPVPEGVDEAVVAAMLEKRREAKRAKEFDAADQMQSELLAMGVWVNDKTKTWSATKDRQPKGYKLVGEVPEGVEVEAVTALLAKRVEAKKARNFDESDRLQKELMVMGVYVNDKARTWEQSKWAKEKAAEAKASPAEEGAAPAAE